MIKNNKGFTIVEAIIVTAVLAAVTVMAFPNFIQFFQIQEETREASAMAEIKSALESYAEENKSLPAAANWAVDLAPYASLSSNAIANDVWGQPRLYKRVTENVNFRSAAINVDYVVVYSHGMIRGEGDTGVDFNLAGVGVFDDKDDYAAIEATFGDSLVRFTNYRQQIANYKETERRLKDISDALASYATTAFNEAIVGGVANAEQYIYYPPSAGDDGDIAAADIPLLYGATTIAGLNNISAGTIDQISVDDAGDATRKVDMTFLMRMLGLPDSHCCEALTPASRAFFYYSNPKPRLAGGPPNCGARPTALTSKLPPRVRVTADECG